MCKELKLKIKWFFLARVFFTSFVSVWVANQENLRFSVSKCLVPVEKCEIVRRLGFSKSGKFSTLFFFLASENNFFRFSDINCV
jgi:hypothetical protein